MRVPSLVSVTVFKYPFRRGETRGETIPVSIAKNHGILRGGDGHAQLDKILFSTLVLGRRRVIIENQNYWSHEKLQNETYHTHAAEIGRCLIMVDVNVLLGVIEMWAWHVCQAFPFWGDAWTSLMNIQVTIHYCWQPRYISMNTSHDSSVNLRWVPSGRMSFGHFLQPVRWSCIKSLWFIRMYAWWFLYSGEGIRSMESSSENCLPWRIRFLWAPHGCTCASLSTGLHNSMRQSDAACIYIL